LQAVCLPSPSIHTGQHSPNVGNDGIGGAIQQALLFLKLDFSKVYDMVDWGFLFGAMNTLGFPSEFIDLIKLLFKNATACVKVNGSLSESFKIARGVRQGCPVAPYLFLIAAEVLNMMVATKVEQGRVKGIELPFRNRQQIIAQYANDTSFTLTGEEEPVRNLIYLLETFCAASGLVLNWSNQVGIGNITERCSGLNGLII
jgi:hypothetical protein